MVRRRISEEKILSALKSYDNGVKLVEICREHGISRSTFYKWKERYSGMDKLSLVKLKSLEKENSRLKKLVADLTLDKEILKESLEKNF